MHTEITDTEHERKDRHDRAQAAEVAAPASPFEALLSDPERLKELDADKVEKLLAMWERQGGSAGA